MRAPRRRESNSRPVASLGAEHGPHAPPGAEHVQGLGEAVVVDDARVDGEQPHQQDDVAAGEHHVEYLQRGAARGRKHKTALGGQRGGVCYLTLRRHWGSTGSSCGCGGGGGRILGHWDCSIRDGSGDSVARVTSVYY